MGPEPTKVSGPDTIEPLDAAGLAAELREITTKLRARVDLETMNLPELRAAARICANGSVEALLDEAIVRVQEPDYRMFLELLLPLPFEGDERWRPLGSNYVSPEDAGRGVQAGFKAFGVTTWEGLRAPLKELGGDSRRDRAEQILAASILELVSSAEAARSGRRHTARSGRTLAWLAVALALVGGALAWVAISTDEPQDPEIVTDPPTTCRPLEEAAAQAGIDESTVVEMRRNTPPGEWCVDSIDKWDEVTAVTLAGADDAGDRDLGDPPGPVLVSSPVGVVALTASMYQGYRQIGASDGSRAQPTAGFPTEVMRDGEGGSIEVHFTEGVVLVGEDERGPFFWIPGTYVDWWRDAELGRPTGNPMPDLTQDFELGRARLELSESPAPSPELVADPRSELLGDRAEQILRQADGTAWWVDGEDRRWWIPDGGTWDCLGGDENLASGSVPGYSVATLDFAGRATCDQST